MYFWAGSCMYILYTNSSVPTLDLPVLRRLENGVIVLKFQGAVPEMACVERPLSQRPSESIVTTLVMTRASYYSKIDTIILLDNKNRFKARSQMVRYCDLFCTGDKVDFQTL